MYVYNAKPTHLWTTQKTHLAFPPATPESMKVSPNFYVLGIIGRAPLLATKEVLASS
jgi:hypothetical protein